MTHLSSSVPSQFVNSLPRTFKSKAKGREWWPVDFGDLTSAQRQAVYEQLVTWELYPVSTRPSEEAERIAAGMRRLRALVFGVSIWETWERATPRTYPRCALCGRELRVPTERYVLRDGTTYIHRHEFSGRFSS